MREKLIEFLADLDCDAEYCKDCEFCNDIDGCVRRQKEIIADRLIANGVTVQKWIPVTERLPEGDKVVMCYKAGRGMGFGTLLDATYADGAQAFMDRDRTFAFGVTHWMPLPEPPKGE